MPYKISLTLEVSSRKNRDELLEAIADLLRDRPAASGKIRTSHETKIVGGQVDLLALGVEEVEPTPIERAIAGNGNSWR